MPMNLHALINNIHEDKSLLRQQEELKEHIANKYPGQGDFFYDYWATRLMIASMGSDVDIDFDNPIDPNKITITITPDYGS